MDRPRRHDESPVAYGIRTRRFSSARAQIWATAYAEDPAAITRQIEGLTPAPAHVDLTAASVQTADRFDASYSRDAVAPEFAHLFAPMPGEQRDLSAAAPQEISDDELFRRVFGE